MFSADDSTLYILVGVLIFLSLMAALGSWLRGRGINRQDAEFYFDKSRQQTAEEVAKLKSSLEESRKQLEETVSALTLKLNDTAENLNTALESNAAKQMAEINSRIQETEVKLIDTGRNQADSISKIESSLTGFQQELSEAAKQVRLSLTELTRQQQEAKAQSAMQLCEALISSLGTLKNSISKQMETSQNPPVETVLESVDSAPETPGLETAHAEFTESSSTPYSLSVEDLSKDNRETDPLSNDRSQESEISHDEDSVGTSEPQHVSNED